MTGFLLLWLQRGRKGRGLKRTGETSLDKDLSEQVGQVHLNKVDDSAGMIHLCKAWVFIFPVMLWAVFQVPASI